MATPPLVPCRVCKKEVAATALTCPHCGATNPSGQVGCSGKGCLYSLLALIVVALGLGIYAAFNPSPPSVPAEAGGEPSMAFVQCQQAVRARLRAPQSAKFPYDHASATSYLGQGRYLVRSYVDAQNAFGAELRKQYVCDITAFPGGSWRVARLQMEE